MAQPLTPDPALGVFETMLVVRGEPVELDAHLRRMHESARTLFGEASAARVRGPADALALSEARRLGVAPADSSDGSNRFGRLRIALVPTDGALDLSAKSGAVDPALLFPDRAHGPELTPVAVAGGLGAHKWADRRLLEAATAELDGALPLLVDGDGAVLEADRANVFALTGGALVTPPTDGRILPGVARATTLAIARELGVPAAERGIALDELRAADAAFLTGSVRGIEPVRAIAGRPMGADPAVDRLATALRARWLGGG